MTQDPWMVDMLKNANVAWDDQERIVLILPDDHVVQMIGLDEALKSNPELMRTIMQLLLWNLGVKSSKEIARGDCSMIMVMDRTTRDRKLRDRISVRFPSGEVQVPGLDLPVD